LARGDIGLSRTLSDVLASKRFGKMIKNSLLQGVLLRVSGVPRARNVAR